MPHSGQLLRDTARTLLFYVRGQFLIASILTLLYLAGFYWIGVPLWWLAAFLCGPMNLVPIAGAAVAALIPLVFSLLGGAGIREVLMILVFFGAVQAFETFYLAPKILGRELQLHPLVVFFAVLIGAVVFGPIGAILAAPAVAIALLMIRYRNQARRQS